MFIVKSDEDYTKIRGLLAFILMFLYVNAFKLFNNLFSVQLESLHNTSFVQLISPSNITFDIIVFIKVYGELFLYTGLFILNIKIIYSFHRRKKNAPRLFLAFVLINFSITIFSISCIALSKNLTFANFDISIIQMVIYNFIFLLLASIYLNNSERSKLTLIK